MPAEPAEPPPKKAKLNPAEYAAAVSAALGQPVTVEQARNIAAATKVASERKSADKEFYQQQM